MKGLDEDWVRVTVISGKIGVAKDIKMDYQQGQQGVKTCQLFKWDFKVTLLKLVN